MGYNDAYNGYRELTGFIYGNELITMKHGFIGMNLVRDFSSINKGRLLVLGILAIYSFQNALMHLYANNMDGTIGIQGDSTAEYAGQE